MDYDLPEELSVTVDGGVRILTLNRPESRNAFNIPMHHGLTAFWSQVAADPDARAIVLTGAGKAFSAGGDMSWIENSINNHAVRHQSIRDTEALVRAMASCALPIVAAVNGPAVGLGCSVLLLCDLIYMAETAFIADPHVAIGLVAADGGAVTWPLATSLLKAKEYLYTGDRIPAAEAERIGLANYVVPTDEVLDRALTMAQRLAAQPAFALQQTKRAVNRHLERAISDVLAFALAAQSESHLLPDVRAKIDEFKQR
jgi:enoyl-CoA hydratase/carnithine racemase